MTGQNSNYVLLFKAVSYVLKAEKILKQEGLPYKLIPVPKQISSDCGVCLLVHMDVKDKIVDSLQGEVDIENIRKLAD
ncbi:MAG: DUF3343 domain-containing protein [Smithella sp.]|jgi:hypothetical protein